MRKLHWYIKDRSACRPDTLDDLKRDPAATVSLVTCKPCLKALGLSPVVLKASSQRVSLTLCLPNGKKPVCLAENFELKIESAPAYVDMESFVNHEPEPISLKATLTDAGWSALKEAMIGK